MIIFYFIKFRSEEYQFELSTEPKVSEISQESSQSQDKETVISSMTEMANRIASDVVNEMNDSEIAILRTPLKTNATQESPQDLSNINSAFPRNSAVHKMSQSPQASSSQYTRRNNEYVLTEKDKGL